MGAPGTLVKLDQRLVDAAVELLEKRFPEREGTAAAVYTADGDILTGIALELDYCGVGLCAETGPILEAHKLNKAITASVCVCWSRGRIVILSPCGVCQERLFCWGEHVEVAVPHPDDPTRWIAKTLKDVQPYHWLKVF
jgi:cytidine deaminase